MSNTTGLSASRDPATRTRNIDIAIKSISRISCKGGTTSVTPAAAPTLVLLDRRNVHASSRPNPGLAAIIFAAPQNKGCKPRRVPVNLFEIVGPP